MNIVKPQINNTTLTYDKFGNSAVHLCTKSKQLLPHHMNKAPLESSWKSRGQNGAVYTCTDGVCFRCGCEVFDKNEEKNAIICFEKENIAPKNGILLEQR